MWGTMARRQTMVMSTSVRRKNTIARKLKLKAFVDNLQLSAVQLLQCNDIVERGAGCKLLRLQIAGAVFIRGRVVKGARDASGGRRRRRTKAM